MKKLIFIALIAFSAEASHGQDVQQNTSRGTWVVESTIRTPKIQVIKFYNSSLRLIYEESVTHKKIRYVKARIKKALDQTLEIALTNEKKLQPGTFAAVLKTRNPKARLCIG